MIEYYLQQIRKMTDEYLQNKYEELNDQYRIALSIPRNEWNHAQQEAFDMLKQLLQIIDKELMDRWEDRTEIMLSKCI